MRGVSNKHCLLTFFIGPAKILLFVSLLHHFLSPVIIQECRQSVNTLNPDQAQHFDGPDLDPKCL